MLGLVHAGLVLALGLGAAAQSYVDSLSFGHQQSVSPNSFAIPGWTMLGQDYMPQLLSDKVILTPPYGGNKKGALWADSKNWLADWQADLEFRVGASDRGVGSLQLWYVSDGPAQGSTHTLYTAHKFDGLVLVIDTNGGVQKIRGFLNDGSTDYASQANVDGLAFGHCDYAYRNRPTSRLSVKSTSAGLSVTIDDQPCFSSDKISLPVGDHFGLTASSGDPPDSFEVFKFAVSRVEAPLSTQNTPPQQQQEQQQKLQPPAQQQQQRQSTPNEKADNSKGNGHSLSVEYVQLSGRLDLISKSISNLFNLVTERQRSGSPSSQQGTAAQAQAISSLENRLSTIESLLRDLVRAQAAATAAAAPQGPAQDYSKQFAQLSEQLQKTHEGVTEHMPLRIREYMLAHTPRIGFILYSFMAFQTCCIGAWGWYKWRKSTMPKKYL